MKQTIIFLSILFCFFGQKSRGQISITDLSNFGNTMRIGTVDTGARWMVTTDSIGGSFQLLITDTSGNLPGSMMHAVKLYKDTNFFCNYPLASGATAPIAGTLTPHDTVVLTLLLNVDSMAHLGDSIRFGVGFIFNSPTTFVSTVWSQKMTVVGSRLKIKKDTTVSNAIITLGTGKLLASYDCTVEGVDSFHTVYALITNAGNCPSIACKNVTLKKGTQVQGSPITVLGTSSPIVFGLTLPPGITNLKIYSDVDSNAVDSSTIQLSTVFDVNGPTNAVIMADSLAQIMTIDKPTTSNGPCGTTISEIATYSNIYVGHTEYLGAFAVESENCHHTITGMKLEVFGTELVSKCLNAEIYDQYNNTFGNLISSMNYVNNFSDNYAMWPGEVDTFAIIIDVANNAIPGKTYQIQATVSGVDENNDPFTQVILLDEKTIAAYPTEINTISEKTISMYPNPATNIIQFKDLEKGMKFQITDMVGKRWKDGIVSNIQNQIDIHDLPLGNYVINLISEKNNHKIKFIKQ